tara:strand:- start:302 stop:526 length:225 start_codon:yes stop_codon:yes gene_type:complete
MKGSIRTAGSRQPVRKLTQSGGLGDASGLGGIVSPHPFFLLPTPPLTECITRALPESQLQLVEGNNSLPQGFFK